MSISTLERFNNTTETEEFLSEEAKQKLAEDAIKRTFGPAKQASNFVEGIKRSEELSPSPSTY